MSKHEEREQRLVHRIEAFSDLVMGFSLALLSLSLVIPAHAIELLLNPIWLVSYLWTFAWIASTWFGHQRLFSLYFVPTMPAIVINFVLLASLALGVYFVQVFLHAGSDPDRVIAMLLYFSALSVTLLSLGTLYALGTKSRWNVLDGDERFFGTKRAIRLLIMGT
ncbi:MAG TPA: TMEM175 family protein, partial [Candidatus Aquilonibacter sp.]|nr:TMEM175 family protein [Candidatus Aquilonibacter sp.]